MLPALQGEHTTAPAAETELAGHLEHTRAPCVAAIVPGAHAVQFALPDAFAYDPGLQE